MEVEGLIIPADLLVVDMNGNRFAFGSDGIINPFIKGNPHFSAGYDFPARHFENIDDIMGWILTAAISFIGRFGTDVALLLLFYQTAS